MIARHSCGSIWMQIGSRSGHCCSCHHTFSTERAFDQHRQESEQTGGVCTDPATMVTKAGNPRFVARTDRSGAMVWALNDPLPERLKAMWGRSS